jgi:hypothetical protein
MLSNKILILRFPYPNTTLTIWLFPLPEVMTLKLFRKSEYYVKPPSADCIQR